MISHSDVARIANLARLELSEEETTASAKQLDAVLGYVEQLKAIDTTGVEPTCFVAPEHDTLRDDTRTLSLTPEALLKNGPRVINGFFAVPKVIAQ